MKAGGILVILMGVWVGCQVLGGDALGRLKIAGAGPTAAPAPGGPATYFGPNLGYNPGPGPTGGAIGAAGNLANSGIGGGYNGTGAAFK